MLEQPGHSVSLNIHQLMNEALYPLKDIYCNFQQTLAEVPGKITAQERAACHKKEYTGTVEIPQIKTAFTTTLVLNTFKTSDQPLLQPAGIRGSEFKHPQDFFSSDSPRVTGCLVQKGTQKKVKHHLERYICSHAAFSHFSVPKGRHQPQAILLLFSDSQVCVPDSSRSDPNHGLFW